MAVRRALLSISLCATLAACGGNTPDTTGDAGHGDAGSDAGTHPDAGPDGGSHADAGTDGGSDAGPPPGSPGAPALAATSTPSPRAILLSWTAADALATQFEILRSDNGGPFTRIDQVPGATLTYSDTSAAIGDPYAYKVTASDSAGTGAPSNEVDVLGSPFDVEAGGSDTKVIVQWTATDSTDSYDVYRVPASGAPQLLGNTTATRFLDDGSKQAVTTGASYSYEVVAKSGGPFVASVGSNVATTTALGLDVTANQIFVSDTMEETRSLAPSLVLEARNVDGGPLLNDAGAPLFFESVSDGVSAMVVPGVPNGTYALTVEGFKDYAVGSARAVDYSLASAGRSSVLAASGGTQIAYSLSGLAAWNTGADGGPADALEAISLGAHDFAANLANDIPAAPGAGDTTFTGTETLGGDTDSHLISASAGDALYLFQLHAKVSSTGVAYLSPSDALANHAFTTADGATTTLAGALQAPAPIAIASLDFPRSAYLDPAHATLNPAATNAAQRIYLEQEKGFAAHGWYSNEALADGLILQVPQDGGTAEADGGVDVNAGALSWAAPAAGASPAWDSFVLVQSTYDVPFTISFQNTSTTPTSIASASTTFTSYSSATVPMSGTTFANSALLPTLSAPRAPQLNGTSLFASQASVAATSRLGWSAPVTGTPAYYLVVIYAIVPQMNDDGTFVTDGSGNFQVDIAQVASFTTHATSVQLAADLVHAGLNYFATVDAVTNSNAAGPIDGTVKPYTLGSSYSASETVTATFTIAAPVPSRSTPRSPGGPARKVARPGPLAKGGEPRRLLLPRR